MNDPGGLDPVLLDLLVEWEERRAAGIPATPEDVCRACPERAADLRRCVARMEHLDTLLSVAAAPAPPDVPGFDLLEEVGRGGMGVVYRARDRRLDRVVAVKVPSAPPGTRPSLERFEREARTLAKLRHPGIVPVHAAGVADGTPYLVMEYVPGGSLADRMAEVVGTPARAAALLAQVAEAVDYAHTAGVIHRDLKPSNILLTEAGRPVVGDFGVAALLAGEPLADPGSETPDDRRADRLTRTGAAVGTPAYTAPECGRGPLTPAADVWSLGVILYQSLTGQLPYPAPAAAGEALPAPPRPRAVRRGVPRGLEAVALRCVAADPADRFPTAAAVAAALTGWGRRRAAGRRLAAAAAAILAVAAAAGALLLARPASPELARAAKVRSARDALGRGEAVALIPAAGAPPDHRLRVGDARTTAGEDGAFSVDAGAAGPVLVELLDDTAAGRYRYSVDVREDGCDGKAQVGLYYAHQAVPAAAGPVHVFGLLAFSDLGPSALSADDRDGTRKSVADLTHRCLAPPWAARDAAQLAGGVRLYSPPAGGAAEARWHTVVVEVTETAVRGEFDGERLEHPTAGGPFRLGDINAWARQLPALVPALGNSQVRVIPRGGVGLYLSGCRASFRNARVEPLTTQ